MLTPSSHGIFLAPYELCVLSEKRKHKRYVIKKESHMTFRIRTESRISQIMNKD